MVSRRCTEGTEGAQYFKLLVDDVLVCECTRPRVFYLKGALMKGDDRIAELWWTLKDEYDPAVDWDIIMDNQRRIDKKEEEERAYRAHDHRQRERSA